MMRWLAILLLVPASACTKTNSPSAGSQTHFLTSCEASCPEPYDCTCGVCTQVCTDDSSCEALVSGALCVAPEAECGEASTCDVECEREADCASLSAMHTCIEGRCRVPVVEVVECRAAGASCTPLQIEFELDAVAEGAPCEWPLPDAAPGADELCSATVALSEPVEGRRTITTRMVASADACAGGTGWYMTASATGRRVVLCPDACVNATGIAASQATLSVSCQTDGGAAGDAGAAGSGGSGATDRGVICDGSDDIRLGLTSAGGMVDSTYEFTNPYGHEFLFVNGQCAYYASQDWRGGMRTGTLTTQQATQLAAAIGWTELDAFAANPDVDSCPDGSTSTIWAPSVSAACTCGCSSSPVMVAKQEAIASIRPWIEMLVMEGAPLDVPILGIAHELGPEMGNEQPWPLDRPLTEIDGLVQDVFAPPPLDPPVRFDDPVDSAALRAVPVVSGPDQLLVSEAGVSYQLFLLDELDADVRASIDVLLDGAQF